MQHQNLARGRWYQMSLAEQLGNIGSEVSRCLNWQNKNKERLQAAAERAWELFDLTLQDKRWRGRYKEIARARELFTANILGGENYKTSLEDLNRYFLNFAVLARH